MQDGVIKIMIGLVATFELDSKIVYLSELDYLTSTFNSPDYIIHVLTTFLVRLLGPSHIHVCTLYLLNIPMVFGGCCRIECNTDMPKVEWPVNTENTTV